MFPSTLPAGASELMRVSDFRRYLRQQHAGRRDPAGSRLSSLTPSLLQDLLRFEREAHGGEVLEVVAAALRHGRDLLVHLGVDAHVLPLTIFPAERLMHCPLAADQLLGARLDALQVMQVEPALLTLPGPRHSARERARFVPLAPLTWALAMRGARETLLPELAGPLAYRVTPGADLRALVLGGSVAAAVARLRREAANLRELSAFPGFDRARAMRLLNALYLQSALIVSRAHPAATNEAWRPQAG